MPTPFTKHLVSTKFSPPRIGARHVPRTNLLAQLDRVHQAKLALVSGSAGYGKTVLLAQWRQNCLKSGAEVAWLSLTADDGGYADFCTELFAAMQRLGISVETDVPLDDTSASAMDAAIAAIVEGAVELPKDVYLIIDDYHHVEAPAAHKFVQKLLDHGPGNLHLVISSRVTPPLSLSRLRMMGQIVEVDSAELPFDLPETRHFLDENLGSGKINADELSLIHELTSGWPSCLQLIVTMLRNRPEARTMLQHLVWRSNDLQTYLSEEIIAHLPEELTAFAESVSVFRRFNASLAQSVTGQANAADLLKKMEDDNLLTIRIDSDDRMIWYRLHRLFGEYLSTRLERRGRDAVNELHRRGARWFAQNGLLAEAMRHASLGNDIEFATGMIERAAPATWNLDYLSPTLHLLDRVPEEVLFRHPRLLFLACLTVSLTSRPAKAQAWLAQLRSGAHPVPPEIERSLPLVEAAIAFQHDDAARMIELLEPVRDAAVENPFLRYMLIAELGVAYRSAGRFADAKRLFDTHPIPLADRNNDMALVAEATLVSNLMFEGRMGDAERLGSALLARSVNAAGHHSISANVCAGLLAEVYYEVDRIDDARETIANRRGLLHSSGPDVTIWASVCRARLDLLQEGADAALAFLRQQMSHLQSVGQPRAVSYMLAEQVKVLLAKGDRTGASETAALLDELASAAAPGPRIRDEIVANAALTRAHVLRNDDPAEALRALEIARTHAVGFKRGRLLVLVDLLSGAVLGDMKQTDDATACLLRAVQAGRELGLVRTFVDEAHIVGKQLGALLREKRLDASNLRYLEGLVDKLADAASTDDAASMLRRASTSKTGAVLTQREVEILGLVAQAMSNKRIALTLNITLETVKWNLRNIFAKLGVSSRYDAMVWARKQALIQ
ncbi:LuxR C-terminal-related transcriptional regulator [Caballeronia sp. LZ062]|uniref:LuxR C-terminal-related transcriptional regulator n=1 Tax=unclassified Caballeronia TaxID=2646786 RepID=UPI00285D0393|nr:MULTISPECIES: LuxR C-terminal-related transcriptional regulator [unclassified Caballeronia]MDR5855361.1 LuxR C-terminal-related transcriptional regulator [Caballeronia sp. LZ050]MDR5870111.1 LuxR C-terminal-related transcriptional regulator [Caballeronia sp. LZ062]